jgi:hypothetical protein
MFMSPWLLYENYLLQILSTTINGKGEPGV